MSIKEIAYEKIISNNYDNFYFINFKIKIIHLTVLKDNWYSFKRQLVHSALFQYEQFSKKAYQGLLSMGFLSNLTKDYLASYQFLL